LKEVKKDINHPAMNREGKREEYEVEVLILYFGRSVKQPATPERRSEKAKRMRFFN
jgi:hypothetical protein